MTRDDQLDANNDAGARAALDAQILTTLARSRLPARLTQLCAEMGIRRSRGRRDYHSRCHDVGVALQRLKRAGKVELVKGSGGGWRIP